MVALILCGLAFGGTYFAARKGLVPGLVAALTVGYLYGIIRANVPSTFSHFIFDSAVLGLYAAQLFVAVPEETSRRLAPLKPWLFILIGWPALLVLVPLQDPMIQLVGLRAHIFFLPFLYLGARLNRSEIGSLTLWFAVLNVGVFGFAIAEFFFGVEAFYPRNDVTELIYRSRDINTSSVLGAFRIPATFGNSAIYGGTMVLTVPFLFGLWTQREIVSHRKRLFLMSAIGASALGVFFAASRLNIVSLGLLIVASSLGGRMGAAGRAIWITMIAGVIWLVSTQERLFQRLLTLDYDTIAERLSWGINWTLVDFAFQFPLGNGLGGGGSSIPFFLQHLIRDPRSIENQYGTILLEQGLPGVFIWLAFIIWVLTRRRAPRTEGWHEGRRLLWFALLLYLAQGMIGQGLFTAVPMSPVLLMAMGWMSVRLPSARGIGKRRPEGDSAAVQPWEASSGTLAYR